MCKNIPVRVFCQQSMMTTTSIKRKRYSIVLSRLEFNYDNEEILIGRRGNPYWLIGRTPISSGVWKEDIAIVFFASVFKVVFK